MMITKRYNEVRPLVDQMVRLGKLHHPRGRTRFTNTAEAHFSENYIGRKGILLALYDTWGDDMHSFRTVNYVELNVDPDTDKVDWDFMVAVKTPDGWESFDSYEALGYDTFIKDKAGATKRLAAIKAKQLQLKKESV